MTEYAMVTNGLSLRCKGKSYLVSKDHINYSKILDALSKKLSDDELIKLIDLSDTITKKTYGDKKNYFFYKNSSDFSVYAKFDYLDEDVELDNFFSKKITYLIKNGLPVDNFLKFAYRLYKNPSYTVVKGLFHFVDRNEMIITQDGSFIAFKKIGFDYFDIRTGLIDNHIGKEPRMRRNTVCDDGDNSSGDGLHVCSESFISEYAAKEDDTDDNAFDRIVSVEVAPENVVTIPSDSRKPIIRTCGYKVLEEIPNNFEAEVCEWVYGQHRDGWTMETFNKVVDFYRSFYVGKRLRNFSVLPPSVINPDNITSALIAKFATDARSTFKSLKPIGPLTDADIDIALSTAIDTPKILVGLLSQVDDEIVA